MKVTAKTGPVVGVLQISEPDQDIMLVTDGGNLIRISAGDIRIIGRNTQGVRLVKTGDENAGAVSSVAPVAEREADIGVEGESDS